MKASLIFLLVALYGAVAEDGALTSEATVVATTSSSNSDIGAKVQAALDNAADKAHNAVVSGSAKFNTNLDSALTKGTELVGKAAQLQQNLVADMTTAAQGMTDKGIEQLTKILADMQSSPMAAFITPLIKMKIQGLKLAQQGIAAAGQTEAAKGALLTNVANSAAGAARGVSTAATNAATGGSSAANGLAKQVSSQIGAGIGAIANLGAGLSGRLTGGGGLSSAGGLSFLG